MAKGKGRGMARNQTPTGLSENRNQMLMRQPVMTAQQEPDPSSLQELPATFQALSDYFGRFREVNPFRLRQETFLRIEKITHRPLFSYVTKTSNLPGGAPAYIDNSDLTGFGDLVWSVNSDQADVFLVSNGGSAEAAERIVRLLRERFKSLRFIIPANAYSAATLMCFAGDEIVMDSVATLGPIDPQINGIPARAILRAFESVEARLKEQGPEALTAYMPLLAKYDLHLLEICKSADALSKELAANWLSVYMLHCEKGQSPAADIVAHFSDYDLHKSHARSIDRASARTLGLRIVNLEEIDGLGPLVRSLYNQYELWFDKTSFYKMFENAYGIHWGRQVQSVTLQIPQGVVPNTPIPAPQPGPPHSSDK